MNATMTETEIKTYSRTMARNAQRLRRRNQHEAADFLVKVAMRVVERARTAR